MSRAVGVVLGQQGGILGAQNGIQGPTKAAMLALLLLRKHIGTSQQFLCLTQPSETVTYANNQKTYVVSSESLVHEHLDAFARLNGVVQHVSLLHAQHIAIALLLDTTDAFVVIVV